MTASDRALGMDRRIERRDFLNGMAVGITGTAFGVPGTPGRLLAQRAAGPLDAPAYYPPSAVGLRGNHPGSIELFPRIEHGDYARAFAGLDAEEEYDLVIVGGGLSGLAAACFWRRALGDNQRRIVALDPDRRGAQVWVAQAGDVMGRGDTGFGGAFDGEIFYRPLAFPDDTGAVSALRAADGTRAWYKTLPKPPCPREAPEGSCNSGNAGSATAIPGVVFTGSREGVLRGYSTKDGRIVWTFNMNRAFETLNGVQGIGGSFGGPGPTGGRRNAVHWLRIRNWRRARERHSRIWARLDRSSLENVAFTSRANRRREARNAMTGAIARRPS